ncbi:MAG: response regulator [Rectinemataceae bacterium]
MIRVLIADDEALERQAVRHILGRLELDEDFVVEEASNGIEALARAEESRPDIVLLDIRMPGIDGLQVAEALAMREHPPLMIMVTAYDQFGYARTALRYGVIDYLLKPASSAEIEHSIRRAIERIRRRKEEVRQSTISSVAVDMTQMAYAAAAESLSRGILDVPVLERLSLLAFQSEIWSCLVLAGVPSASMLRDEETAAAKLQSLRKFLAGFARVHLGSDLGLAPGTAQFVWDALLKGRILVLLLWRGEWKAATRELSSRIKGFLSRCMEAGMSPLVLGASIGERHSAGQILPCALLASSLANPARPVVVFRADDVHAAQGMQKRSARTSRSAVWLQDHFMEHIGLGDMARALNLSPSHLSRQLKSEFGMGFSDMLTRIRIAHAKSLLDEGISAKEAAFLVGFRDQSYFTKAFLKIEGVLPSHYRSGKRK